jgi:hypothetical protein
MRCCAAAADEEAHRLVLAPILGASKRRTAPIC